MLANCSNRSVTAWGTVQCFNLIWWQMIRLAWPLINLFLCALLTYSWACLIRSTSPLAVCGLTNTRIGCMCHKVDPWCVWRWLSCTHGPPTICSPLRNMGWWRLSHPLAKIRPILPPFKTGPKAILRSESHYEKHVLNWFGSANTISWCLEIINIPTPNLTKRTDLDGESC